MRALLALTLSALAAAASAAPAPLPKPPRPWVMPHAEGYGDGEAPHIVLPWGWMDDCSLRVYWPSHEAIARSPILQRFPPAPVIAQQALFARRHRDWLRGQLALHP